MLFALLIRTFLIVPFIMWCAYQRPMIQHIFGNKDAWKNDSVSLDHPASL
jgi:hypothetical protein